MVWRNVAGNWAVTAQLQRPDGAGDLFLQTFASVRLSNGWLLAGAPRDDASASNVDQGSILSYSLVDGVATPRQRLWHGSGNRPDNLGAGVAIDGDHAVTIAPGADAPGGVLDRGALHFLRRDGAAGWSFVQSVAGDANSGAPAQVALSGDLAYVAYPDAQASGLPAAVVRVFRRDGSGTWASLCDLQPPVGTNRPVEALRAAAIGAMAVMDGNRVAFWTAPVGASCPTGGLFPNTPNGNYFGVNLEGTVAALEWDGPVSGTSRRGVDVYDYAGGNWSLSQTLLASNVNGLAAEGYEAGQPDGLNRLLVLHRVPVSTIDSRFDMEIWTRPAPGSPYTLTRTFTPSTSTGGFGGGFFVGDVVMLGDPNIGANGGLAVYDPATGARLQSLVPPGLTVEDEAVDAGDFSGTRGIVGVSRQNRLGVNHAGLVYLIEATANRGGLPTYGTFVPLMLPPAGGDALFFDGLEVQAY